MDLFGKRRIAELEKQIESMRGWHEDDKERLATAKNRIREMDDRIFRISQCSDWASMRPHVNELINMMEGRRRDESDRIGGIILEELSK